MYTRESGGADTNESKTRQEQRDRRKRKERGKIPQHGKSMGRVYRDAVLKRLRRKAG